MTVKADESRNAPAVGTRVNVAVRELGSGEPTSGTGVVVEDYIDTVADVGAVGREWAPIHRWAIALDDGRLVFANDEVLTYLTRKVSYSVRPILMRTCVRKSPSAART
jgi:hypothetical protein